MAAIPGHPEVEIVLRRSARARRYSLRVSRLDGRVTLSLPLWAPEAEAMAFARDRADWIRAALARLPDTQAVGVGATVPVEGRPHLIVAGAGRALRQGAGELAVPGAQDRAGLRVAAYLKHLARERLTAACDGYAARLGRGYGSITLRDTRSRWGSCSAAGGLMFSWRLVMAPPEVLSYVAAHEVAHLVEMNHAPAFWAVVARLMPDYDARRHWLRDHGAALHAIRFEP